MARRGNAEKPQRSCISCRVSKDNNHLLRYVRSPDGEIVADPDGRLPGRGAYTCLSSVCLVAALKQRQFNRAFKGENIASGLNLVEQVTKMLEERVRGLIGLANKAGKIIGGGSMVSDAIRGGRKPGLVLVATDVSETIGTKIIAQAKRHDIPCCSILTKDDFGAILGKAPRSAVAVLAGGFVVPLVGAIDRYRNFLGEV